MKLAPPGLAFACLAATLVLLPLGAGKPGLPPTLKADEPAYFLMALSLARDGDLRCEPHDLRRLEEQYFGRPTQNLILMTDDGWRTVYFGKPFVYSLAAAPAAALFGANGMVSFNMALLVGMIGMGAVWLRRWNPDWLALLFSAGFFLLSTAFVYAFWLQPELFNMFAVAACLSLGLQPAAGEAAGRGGTFRRVLRSPPVAAAVSGAALALAAYNKPVLGVLGAPVLGVLLARRGRGAAISWLSGAVLAGLTLCAVSYAWTGHPSPYLGVQRAGVSVPDPDRMPVQPVEVTPEAPLSTQNSWHWIFRVPALQGGQVLEDAGYFLWGRHTGLLLYLPFAALSLLLFLAHRRRSPEGWALLAAAAAIALFFLLWIPFNWHGGGGFVGNRYFVNAYPAFLYLVGPLRPTWSVAAGYAAGGLLLGPLLLTPFGAPVPHPTLQAHTRNWPLRLFPLELSILRQIPGYEGATHAGVWFVGRRDLFRSSGDEMEVLGAAEVELHLMSHEPLATPVFQVRGVGQARRVRIALGGDAREVEAGSEEPAAVSLSPGEAWTVRKQRGRTLHVYRARLRVLAGSLEPAEEDQGVRPRAALVYLGEAAELARDLYRVEWGECEVPGQAVAGGTFSATVRLWNRSEEAWPSEGATRVALAYHWLDPGGGVALREGRRTPLGRDVQPGDHLEVPMEIEAPARPGTYLLEVEPLRQRVAWFGERCPDCARRFPVEVEP